MKRLEDEDKQAEREHQERMAKLDEEIRLALFKRSGLKDQLMNLSDATALKDRNDRRIKELEEEYARRQVEDSEMLQNLKGKYLIRQNSIECVGKNDKPIKITFM